MNRAPVSVIESDCDPRTAIPCLVDSIERCHIGKCSQNIELRREICLSNEERSLSGGSLAFGYNAVICENQTLSSDAMPRNSARCR
jgi:hypothetical protein